MATLVTFVMHQIMNYFRMDISMVLAAVAIAINVYASDANTMESIMNKEKPGLWVVRNIYADPNFLVQTI